MRSTREVLIPAALIAATTLLAACGPSDGVTMRVGTVYQVDHTISQGSAEFERLVEEYSGGDIEVEVFYAEELGSEREMAEMTRMGGLEVVLSGLPGTGAYVPQIEVMEAFYTYDSVEELARITDAISGDLNRFMEAQGFHWVGTMYQGPRNLLSTRPIRSIDDMAGLRLRVPQTPLFVALARSWGATPTAISFREVYTALESGVVDAVETAIESMKTMGFAEQAKYYMATEHNFYPQPIVANLTWWNGLSPEHRAIIERAAAEAGAYQLSLHKAAQDEALRYMVDELDVEIIELDDLAPFRDRALAAMNEYFRDKDPEVYAVYQKMLRLSNE